MDANLAIVLLILIVMLVLVWLTRRSGA